MTNRIFRAIFLVAAAVMLAVSLLTMGMMYQFSAEETTEKLQRETEYIACGIETDGVRYLEKIKDADTRITWVDADGTVLYDSSADASKMENHSDREENKGGHAKRRGQQQAYFRNAFRADALPCGTADRWDDSAAFRGNDERGCGISDDGISVGADSGNDDGGFRFSCLPHGKKYHKPHQ